MTSRNDPLGLVGTTVSDKYAIERVVGEGGFALVYRAIHKVWNRPVAIKVFRALGDLPADRRADLVESFIQEGRLLAELSERSAAICQARDVGTLHSNGREIPFMVLEWLEGRSLEEVLESEKAARMPPRSMREAVLLVEPAADALALAHKKGIAHRDVKPANIFILGDPRGEHTTKLLDFGIAKVVQDAQRLGGSFAQTQGAMSSFTPAYGAPEQFSRSHGATGPWTDVFAMALILSELVTHVEPLRGDDLTQLAFASMDPGKRPTPRALGADVSDAVEAVFSRALAVAPDDRYRSMGELWAALREALSMDPARSSLAIKAASPPAEAVAAPHAAPSANRMQETVPASSRKRSPSPLAIGVAAVVAAGVLAGGGWLLSRRGDDGAMRLAAASASAAAAATMSVTAPRAVAAPPACPSGMIAISGGKFFMGSDDKADEERERPAHQVTLSSYCIDATEVTVAQYKECSDRGECKRAPRENDWPEITKTAHKLYDPLCNIREPEERANHPVNCVDWELAEAFCKARGARLPTEAEWEFATRGSDGRKYPWGDDPPTTGGHLNACGRECVAWGKKHPDPDNPLAAMYPFDDGFATTAPVGSFPKGDSPFGAHDVVGNVWEWTADWYGPYGALAEIDPKGPEKGDLRVMRGGAWNGSDVAWVRPTFRFMAPPTLRSHGIGFRCAKALVTPER